MKTNRLTPDLLRRYAAGTLTPAEQHAVERRLLDDPLAAEAAEGLARLREEGVDADAATAAVRARLQQRVAKRPGRVIPLAWTRYAAAAVVLVGVAGLGWWALREEPTVSQAEKMTHSAAAPSVTETAPAAPAPLPEVAKASTPPASPQVAPKRRPAAQPDVLADEVASPPVASSARVAVAPPADTGRAGAPPTEIAAQAARQRAASAPATRDTSVDTMKLQPAPNALAKAAAPGAAKPTNGFSEQRFPAFDDYARARRRVAGQGTVTLSFRLGPGGRPRRVRVEASNNPALNGEAIRLLREGPGWDETETMRRKGRVVYAVRFE